MQYNYSFEAASLLFMFLVFVHFNMVRQFPTGKTRIFRVLLYTCMGEAVFNILSSIGLANAGFVPQPVNELLAFAFFMLEGLSSVLIYQYTVVICDMNEAETKKAKIAGLIPAAVYLLALAVTPFTGFLYYMEDNYYYRGVGTDIAYLYVAMFFVANLVLILWHKNQIAERERTIIFLYTTVALVSVAGHFFFRGVLLTGVANAVILLMIYFSMQNPNDLLDSVTGIGNEAALEIQLKDAIKRKKKGAVLSVYVRQFHQINLLFGTDNCNKLFAQMGQYFFSLIGKFHVFRSDAATFSMIVSEENCDSAVQAIKKRFCEEWKIGENHILVDGTISILHFPKNFGTIPEFLGMKEYLMEIATKRGSKEPVCASQEMVEGYFRRNKIELTLNQAIHERTIQVYYQPIYSLKEKKIVALEALSRLYDEELGFIPPDEFIPLAEKNGNIIRIGEIVLEECCKFLSKHVLSNLSLGIRSIQVNISVAQCMQQNLKEAILPILEKYHVPSSMIVLELTETTAINTPALMEHHMKELGEAGIGFAMDDYGTGNANCSYLVRFPFREVKIDKEMTWAYFNNETAKIVLENEIKTMHSLGIPMVIEGIEKIEQSEEMERLGVEYIQGYYYGKPLPETECLKYIRNFNSTSEFGR